MNARIERVRSQRARDTATGAEVYNVDRDHIAYERAGRTWVSFVERGVGVDSIYLANRPTWDDGQPMTDDEVRSARESIELVLADWGIRTDFVV